MHINIINNHVKVLNRCFPNNSNLSSIIPDFLNAQPIKNLLQNHIVNISAHWALQGAKLGAIVRAISVLGIFVKPHPLMKTNNYTYTNLGISSAVIISALSLYGSAI